MIPNTQYLYNNGIQKFFTWYDYKSWHPIGRPIGTTIYPGMQFTATFMKKFIFKESMSLNDICCYIPAWFGVIASILVGMITYEITLECNTKQSIVGVLLDSFKIINEGKRGKGRGSVANWDRHGHGHGSKKKKIQMGRDSDKSNGSLLNVNDNNGNNYSSGAVTFNPVDRAESNSSINEDKEESNFLNLSSPSTECAIAAMGIMGMVPAHLTRSIGGGFDNESVAMSAMCLTFYFWIRSLRTDDEKSHLFGIATGIAYFYVSLLLFFSLLFFAIAHIQKMHLTSILTLMLHQRWLQLGEGIFLY